MAQWPTSAQLAQSQDVDNADDWEWRLSRVMAAAIAHVKRDVGEWVEGVDEPDDALAEAALRMADLMSQKGLSPDQAANDGAYRALLKGHRRKFGVA